ncbi:hypothetical protein AJ80_01210 [Polytolypa hystricis UAMH7299]|uniref:Uncharacterized protein n=1 Tax=Polytolypa hystricis (strain UAMH7299) TaxID=1447883 RepID=A0A2B7Z0A3_POLH7|nr:hypothetical protein AJ80_01210 [Polytolypa hystricis UAMH7299]
MSCNAADKTFEEEVLLTEESGRSDQRKRHANVYDAVAGRVSSRGFRLHDSLNPDDEAPTVSNSIAVPPEEALFRQLNAPVRYIENDFYFANENLLSENRLPDSDMLKAIHTYASDFYANSTMNQGCTDWRSMDETALIALGILLEEAANEALGETGDMVFVEGEEISDNEGGAARSRPTAPRSWRGKRARTVSSSGLGGDEEEPVRRLRRRKKRCRVEKVDQHTTASEGET